MLGPHNHGSMNNWKPCDDPKCDLCCSHHTSESSMSKLNYFVRSSQMWGGAGIEVSRKTKVKKKSFRGPGDMSLEDISLAIDLEIQAKIYRGIREAIKTARQLFDKKELEGRKLSKKEKIGMFITFLRSENYHQLTPSWYCSNRYTPAMNNAITREVQYMRAELLRPKSWSDVGIFNTNHWNKNMVNTEHWGAKALKELASEQMNVDEEFSEMKKSLVTMDVAIKDVNEVNRKASDVINGLYKVAEDLVGEGA